MPAMLCKAHFQNIQSQRSNQISPKSFQVLPTYSHAQKRIKIAQKQESESVSLGNRTHAFFYSPRMK
tara:strand:+ start:760 stop:960 length:201 start_codon:yes stop_codon:yes gene_type:complete